MTKAKTSSPSKAERLAIKLCRAASEESERRRVGSLYGYMLSTILSLAGIEEWSEVDEALELIQQRRWAETIPRGTFILLEAGRQMLKGKG